MSEFARNIDHLVDPAVRVETVEKPDHFDGVRFSLGDLQMLLDEPEQVEGIAPVRIYKAGLNLLNRYNSSLPVPDEVITQFGIQNAESSIQRAYAAKYMFALISGVLVLPHEHLSIAATNLHVEVNRGTKARSAIMPTHFRDGAQLLIPHDDYMYDLTPSELPPISIGEYTTIAQNVRLDVGGGIQIGNRAFIARGTHRIGHTHDKDYPGIVRETMVASHTDRPIYIGDDTLLGYGAEISPSTRYIGQNTVVGQKSIITTPWLGEFSVIVGNNRTIDYLPVQAYFKAEYPDHVNVPTMANIDWKGVIATEWQQRYEERLRQLGFNPKTHRREAGNAKTLVLGHAGDVGVWAALIAQGRSVDYIADNMQDHALVLQLAQDANNYKVRVRTGVASFLQSNDLATYLQVIDNREQPLETDTTA